MRIRLLLLFVIIHIGAFGQQATFNEIDESIIKPWLPKLEIEYQSVYHFGDGEWESELILIGGLYKWYAQIVSGSWSDNGKTWMKNYENLDNVRIEGNKFYSDKTNGEFVFYDSENERVKGLKVYKSWSSDGDYEIGFKSHSLKNNYPGKYPQASLRQLSDEELTKMSKSDLKIMRNEIFARYGYIFKNGGEMDSYFKLQDWYSGQHENIDKFLTDLEKENIKLIQAIENE